MIICGDKIGIEPSDGLRTAHITGEGIVTVGVDKVNEVARHASRVIYDALDQKAVNIILLHDNVRNKVCYPLASYNDGLLEITWMNGSYCEYTDMTHDNGYKIMSLLVNRAVLATNESIDQAWLRMTNGHIPRIDIEEKSYSEVVVEVDGGTLNNVYDIAKVSDKLWDKGYYIKGVTDYECEQGACIIGIGKALTSELSDKDKNKVLNILQYTTRGKVKNAEILYL